MTEPTFDFQLNITPEEARTTTRFPIDPALVLEAYRKTGLRPVRKEWVDHRSGCACPAGAFALAFGAPPLDDALDTFTGSDVVRCLISRFSPSYYEALDFVQAFASTIDGGEPLEAMRELVARQARTGSVGWWILAKRNALAVREALDVAGLELASSDDPIVLGLPGAP